MYLAMHLPYFGASTVESTAIVCPTCGRNDWQDIDLSYCNPGDKLACNQCSHCSFVTWGLVEPDHWSTWLSSEHCPHRLCQLKYRELRAASGWDAA